MLTVEQIQLHFIEELNGGVRRPGMIGGELGLDYLLDRVVYVTETGDRRAWRKALTDAGAMTSIGVAGVVRLLLPDDGTEAIASVYADYSHLHGWLRLDRTLNDQEYGEVQDRLVDFCATDHPEAEVLERFGEPSVRIGGTNPRYPSVFGYTNPDGPIAWFYLWNGTEAAYEQPVLLAGRCGAPFVDSLRFTPEGRRRRPELEF
ncbi:hypothetical protein OHB24_06310 [Kribbella sp. NBC_00482]|uniref:hypothetical protein n=1 Tax=Kribbella sp. NBC_00482 TaxID=2975968 RepID=UPI002E176198